jgi:hypothetical protein
MKFLLAILCVIPSAWVNANAQIALGAGNDMIAGVLLFATLAAVFTMRCMESHGTARIGWGAMALIFMTMNAFISLSGISAVRDTAMDIRAEKQRQANNRQAVVDQVADLRKMVGPASAAVVKAEMDAMPRGDRKDRTRVKLETARQIERLQAQVDGWGAGIEPAPSAVDPGIANIAALAVTIFNVKLNERFLAALLSGAFAILLELGADLGPIAIFSLLSGGSGGLRRVESVQPAKPLKQAVAGIPGNPPTIPDPYDLTEFMTGLCEMVRGQFTQSSMLYRSYVAWAKKHDRPILSQTAFGTTLTGMGYTKVKRSGAWHYHDLRLKVRLVS